MRTRSLLLPMLLICAIFFASGASNVSAEDANADSPGLSKAATELMDEDGHKVLQGIMAKDEMGEDMENQIQNVRKDALRQTAYTLALQKAVKWRYGKIRQALDEQSSRLNEIFDFTPLLMHDGKVLPPAITKAGPGYRVESNTQASSTDAVYRIIREARMISQTPSWRDYLWREYPAFNEADLKVGVLPQDKEERRMWKRAAVRGWEIGIRQAERLYKTNLSRLRRDYSGIVKFCTLAEQGIVSLPVVAEGINGIEVQGKKLSVDRKIFRITQPSSFQGVDQWKPKIGAE